MSDARDILPPPFGHIQFPATAFPPATTPYVGKQHVYEAINAITKELSQVGIAKERENRQQGFKFRGIDQVYKALSPLLAKHHLCIIPRVIQRTQEVRKTASGGSLYDVTVHAEFDFVSSVDGSRHTASMFGEGMDSADKATNKAMSAAFKYLVFQTFCVPLEGEPDADADTHPETGVDAAVRTGAVTGAITGDAEDAKPDGLDDFQAFLAQEATKGEGAYKKAWQSGTVEQRRFSAKIHEELKEMAKLADVAGKK